MKSKKIVSFLVAASIVCTALAGCSGGGSAPASSAAPASSGAASSESASSAEPLAQPGQPTPRNETLYINGLQWAPNPNSFNPMGSNLTAFLANGATARELIFETLYMYNQMDGKMYPLLASGDYSWAEDTCTVKINPDAKWNDGQPVTADDVAYTFELAKKYPQANWSQYWEYLDSVTATDSSTVAFKEKADHKNPLMVEEALESVYIMPKHIWADIESKDNNDAAKITAELNSNPVASGPYKVLETNDQKVSLYRDDNYWGKASSMWGKLPAPRYIVHNIFKDNPAGDNAFKNGEVDVSQQFTPNIQQMGPTIKTYLKDAPYYVSGTIPWLVINVTKPGLDNKDVRRAIAECINYDDIGSKAMSGYTPKMAASTMLPSDVEQSLIDSSALSSLQWGGSGDAAKANALLDSIGAKKGSDGIRVLNGKKLSFKVECPTGWTDWNAALEIVAQSTKAIGIDVTTNFPQAGTWTSDQQTGNFDMIMYSYQGVGISSPWQRAFQMMSSAGYVDIGSKANLNFGRYKNPEADTLLNKIPTETGDALKADWTALNKIYLTDIPAIGMMYRPVVFHTVNTSVWDGFPTEGDGSNIGPGICMDGYGVAALYKIHAK